MFLRDKDFGFAALLGSFAKFERCIVQCSMLLPTTSPPGKVNHLDKETTDSVRERKQRRKVSTHCGTKTDR